MAELNEIRFLLFVSLMILAVRALDVILSGAHQDFKQKSEINIGIVDGEKIYRRTLNRLTYEAQNGTSKVIVYITSRSRCIEILRPAVSEIRSQIAQELRAMYCDLVFLGIEHIDDDEYHLIGAFILEKIQPHPNRPDIIIETIGENRFDQFYGCHLLDYRKYQGNAQNWLAHLRSIPHGAHRPVGYNDKEIKLFGYHPFEREVGLPVHIIDNRYIPDDSDGDSKYDFMIKYPNKKIILLILGGREYLAVTSYGNRLSKRIEMKELLKELTRTKQVLVILGVFNFDWTEIDFVTQIILKHSESWHGPAHNVFTCGYGMFNTYYLNENENDERYIQQQRNPHILEIMKILMNGEEVKQRTINVYYYIDGEWESLNMPIDLINGRYFPEARYMNLTLSCLYEKIAFIVYDFAEINDSIDYTVVNQTVVELVQSGISVVLIEAFNFGSNDMHIIAEWIDHHNVVINSDQIAVLGGGIFESIFQSKATTYNTYLNTKSKELETIRNAYVRDGVAKSVSVASIDYSEFEVWSYSMNTVVNGFYEPDLLPDKNMFDTADEGRAFFIITSAYNFQQIAAMKNLRSVTSAFRKKIRKHYPGTKWRVFLVRLNNFGERDSHLFAELVNRQRTGQCSGKFVRTFHYGIDEAIYQYKDNAQFDVEDRSMIQEHFISFFSDAD